MHFSGCTRPATHLAFPPGVVSRWQPVASYGKLKDCIRLLFWSGQSFRTPGLAHEGKFKAAEARFTSVEQIDLVPLRRWLQESREIQWDYQNIVRRKGKLERLK